MDVQKLIAQAEQALKRGKLDDAIEKFEAVLKEDPQNEVAANKLALTYIEQGDVRQATSLYCKIAKRASEKGKNQKALALYKQALTIDETDPAVLNGLAEESEQLGKFSDAVKYCEQLIAYFLARKRYVQVISCCMRFIRCSSDNENAKLIWLEVVRLLGDEGKLAQALVNFCGPPGLVSPDQQVGGDPSKISQKVLSQLIVLLDWFPADPALPYALGWVAYKTGNKKNAYRFLAESFRRDPDYCLTTMLFARVLIEEGKLTEGQFAFTYAKDGMVRDHRTNKKLLSEQLASFEKLNGWMAFSDGLSGDSLTPEHFLRKIRGEETVAEKAEVENKNKPDELPLNKRISTGQISLSNENYSDPNSNAIDLSTSAGIEPQGDEEFEATSLLRLEPGELELSVSGMRLAEKNPSTQPPPPPPPPKPLPGVPKVAAKANAAKKEASADEQDDPGTTLNNLTRMNDEALEGAIAPPPKPQELEAGSSDGAEENTKTEIYTPQDLVNASKWDRAAAQVEIDNAAVMNARQEKGAIEAHKEKQRRIQEEAREKQANDSHPEEASADKKSSAAFWGLARLIRPKLRAEDTGSIEIDKNEQDEFTQVLKNSAKSEAAPVPEYKAPKINDWIVAIPETALSREDSGTNPEVTSLNVSPGTLPDYTEGEATQVIQVKKIAPVKNPSVNNQPVELQLEEGNAAQSGLELEGLYDGEPTVIRSPGLGGEKPKEIINKPSPRATIGYEGNLSGDEPTRIVPFHMDKKAMENLRDKNAAEFLVPPKNKTSPPQAEAPSNQLESIPGMDLEGEAPTIIFQRPNPAKKNPITPIPLNETEEKIQIDSGEDLLFGSPSSAPNAYEAPAQALDSTQQYLERLEQTRLNLERLLQIADEYLMEGNYYLARKACREAGEQGADPELVDRKLKEIRKKEMPDSVYHKFSTDAPASAPAESVAEIIRKLEQDYNISLEEELPGVDLIRSAKELRQKIEGQISGCDGKIRIDLGVAFYEMGLYEEAENQFLNAINDKSIQSEGTYLAAQAMMARGNYKGAIDLLDNLLSSFGEKEDQESLAVLYLLGQSYEALDEKKKAGQMYRRVAKINRNYRNIQEKLSKAIDG